MELEVKHREGKKTETKEIRRQGNIPAVIYSEGKAGENIVVDGNAMKKVLKKITPGTLPTTIFALKGEKWKKRGIIRNIQYHPTTYNVEHLDFVELHEKVPVEINIPIQFLGAVECAGVKQGGVLRQLSRFFKVRCLPKNIPSHFEIDVKDLALGQTIKLGAVVVPSTVKPLVDLKGVLAIVSKR